MSSADMAAVALQRSPGTWRDPIVDAQLNDDMKLMFEDLRRKETEDPCPKANLAPVVRRKRKPVRAVSTSTGKTRRRSSQ